MVLMIYSSRTTSVKVLSDKSFNIARNPKSDWYQGGLASRFYEFFGKTSWGINTSAGADKTSGSAIKSEIMLNQQLANELHKPVTRRHWCF